VVIVNGFLESKAPQVDTWVYALTAGALSRRKSIVVVYVRQDRVDTRTCDFVDNVNPLVINVILPTSVVSETAFDQAIACVRGAILCSANRCPSA
jgi:hypothetical protein